MTEEAPRPADLPPGHDGEDPYEGEDLGAYPEWWRRNVEEFREHGMRPYRPPRFADGALVPEVLADLEASLGAEVRLRTTDPGSDEWEVLVGGERAGTVERRREADGRSRYLLPAEAFESMVREAAE